jgi:hypothetical protein
MGFKTGAVVGYHLGTKFGRERYEQINTWIDQLCHTALGAHGELRRPGGSGRSVAPPAYPSTPSARRGA